MHILYLTFCCVISKSRKFCGVLNLQTKPWEPRLRELFVYVLWDLSLLYKGVLRDGLHILCFHITWGPCFEVSFQGLTQALCGRGWALRSYLLTSLQVI